ncbi:MAG: phosphohistidine phosphatase SixA [Acidobacteria bacterium]|nr:phosphohistidine phosphatase SixA [Acidobacteriota bacterium]
MELYLLRHGIAEDSSLTGREADRALTAEGKKKLKEILRVAGQADLRPTLIITSPYRRARETAAIAVKSLDYTGELVESNSLVPNAHPQELWEEVRVHRSEQKLLLVSHEPLLSSAGAFLLNSSGLRIDMKKGAVMRIDLEGFSSQPTGLLKWYLTPRLVS